MNKTDENINYSFIKNQPLGEDLFENKSQEKIASVISEKIIKDPDFKIIGIDGEWGSGKSNLVRLIEKKLNSTHKFFVYDVWGHQEDEQRKAILVELTECIKNEKGLLKNGNKKSWEAKLKLLLAKSKETTTINQPYLSVGFIFSLLSIVYIPTVNVFKDSLKDFFEIESWFWKLVLVTFPIFIVIGIYIWNLVNYWFKKSGFWKSFKLSAEETFQVYTNKQKEETKIETISEDQPSVRDFQNWMEEINDDLNKPIVIVFDNFDRLPKKHILSIWSSIHIFFAEKNYSNIKVIIPFDREHVQNAFKDLNGSDNKFGDDYINKTFDIVFRITLPIMSDWKKFFEEQWKKAFKNYDEEEYRLVVQVYEFLSRRITPREIISFINEILTIKLLDNKFKERYIAIFVLKKDEILKDPLKAVTDFKEILGGLTSFYSNDTEYAKQLTAIIYHIDVENALELIYRQELKESLIKNNIEQFNSICKSDFIDSIFVSSIAEIEVFENPIITLEAISEEVKVSSQHINQVWELFYNRVLQLDSDVSKLQIDKWQIALIKKIPDNKYLKSLLDKFYNLIDDSNIEHYIDLIDDLIIELEEEKILNLLIKRNVSEKNYIKLIEYSAADFKKYKLSTDYKSLDEYLSSLKIEEILNFKNSKNLPKEFDFIKLKGLLKSKLNTFIDQNNIESANEIVIRLKEISQKSGSLKNIVTDDKIYTLYVNNSSSKLPIINDLIAMRIANGNSFNSSYANHFNNILNTEDENIANAVGNTILNYTSYGDLLLSSNHFKTSPFFKQIILLMFKKSDLHKVANIISLIEKYSEIKSNLNIEDYSLLKEFNKWEVDKDKFDVNKLNDEFIDDCLKNPELRISKDFLEVFNNEFKSLDKESYETVFGNGTNVHFKYFKHIKLENLTQESLDVFEDKLIETLKSGTAIEKQRWIILSIYDSNNSKISVVNTFKNILDKILTAKIDLEVEDANILLPYFIKYNLLDKQNDIFRLVIKNEFLSNSEFVQLLASNSEYIKTLYAQASKTDKDNFRNLINEKREDYPEFESLAKALDITKSKGKSEEV
ncbi:KAP NTPase domain-containing protein [Candidatus Ornithobacterium hominis]|uniref:P-loop NTPase fold protein n=1 Tax=Candidatus Ornithobacterium hominis TaxID=2497989 RepID=UPI0024BC31C7|nr:P-loop NTPase fold protein [Candidatus Ornithobacterium hominis]CAI9429967.1 KAP NTPase domain-containing protein [Candidatus Ornithobacterium hominis]